ncbi:hypothetical protein D3C81_1768040 [compost metagenome]
MVFGIMLRRLRDVISEFQHHFEADHIMMWLLLLLGREAFNFRVEVDSISGHLQQPGHMVNASDFGLNSGFVHP